MTKLEEIQREIETLSRPQVTKLRKWVEQLYESRMKAARSAVEKSGRPDGPKAGREG